MDAFEVLLTSSSEDLLFPIHNEMKSLYMTFVWAIIELVMKLQGRLYNIRHDNLSKCHHLLFDDIQKIRAVLEILRHTWENRWLECVTWPHLLWSCAVGLTRTD